VDPGLKLAKGSPFSDAMQLAAVVSYFWRDISAQWLTRNAWHSLTSGSAAC